MSIVPLITVFSNIYTCTKMLHKNNWATQTTTKIHQMEVVWPKKVGWKFGFELYNGHRGPMAKLGMIGLYVYNDIIVIKSIVNRLKTRTLRGIWFKMSIINSASQFLCTPFDHLSWNSSSVSTGSDWVMLVSRLFDLLQTGLELADTSWKFPLIMYTMDMMFKNTSSAISCI